MGGEPKPPFGSFLRLLFPARMTRRDLLEMWALGVGLPLWFLLFLVVGALGLGAPTIFGLFLVASMVPVIWQADKVLFFFSFWVPGLSNWAHGLKGWYEFKWKT